MGKALKVTGSLWQSTTANRRKCGGGEVYIKEDMHRRRSDALVPEAEPIEFQHLSEHQIKVARGNRP